VWGDGIDVNVVELKPPKFPPELFNIFISRSCEEELSYIY